jgi:hypothetical protein
VLTERGAEREHVPEVAGSCSVEQGDHGDLARRPDDQVRGRKNLWRFIVTINPGNSIAYWLLGRR